MGGNVFAIKWANKGFDDGKGQKAAESSLGIIPQ
jgi:hypothetical protein